MAQLAKNQATARSPFSSGFQFVYGIVTHPWGYAAKLSLHEILYACLRMHNLTNHLQHRLRIQNPHQPSTPSTIPILNSLNTSAEIGVSGQVADEYN